MTDTEPRTPRTKTTDLAPLLTAIHHTLQAIHTTLQEGTPARCNSTRHILATDHQCIHTRGHSGNHESERGNQW